MKDPYLVSVIILAAGQSQRFNRIEKQLLHIGDQTILERMISECINRYGIVPVVVTHRESIMDHAHNYGACVYRPMSHTVTCDTLLNTTDLWSDQTIVLLGDVVYHHKTFKSIMDFDSDFGVFGNTWEIFAASFGIISQNAVVDAAKRARTHRRGKLRYMYRSWAGLDLDCKEEELTTPLPNFHHVRDWTVDVDTIGEYQNLMREVVNRRRLEER